MLCNVETHIHNYRVSVRDTHADMGRDEDPDLWVFVRVCVCLCAHLCVRGSVCMWSRETTNDVNLV